MIEYAYFFVNTESKGIDAVAVASVATAIMALIVSIIAWRTSSKQLQQNMNHNRLSVRPIISSIQHYDPTRETLAISIVNAGLGPTQIKSVVVSIDGKPLTSSRALADAFNIVAEGLETSDALIQIIGNGHTIRPGDQIDLIAFRCSTAVGLEFFSRYENRCQIELTYVSIYDEAFQANFPENEKIFNVEG